MKFGEKIKNIRKEKKMTQEQMANILNVSRQAISNWENNKNFPDLEMIIKISRFFSLTLDELILGDDDTMTEKLIKDGSEIRKSKLNTISVCAGIALFLFGITCLIIRGITGHSLDANGMLQEYFFLVPLAFIFFFCGFLTFLVTGLCNIIAIFTDKSISNKRNRIAIIVISIVVCLICVSEVFILKIINSGS